VLGHGEGQTRAAYAPLVDALGEHLVPWLAIDLRGHGKSAEQGGKSVASRASRREPAFCAGFTEDVWAAVRWLVDARKHDPKRIGIMGASLGASPAITAAHLHKGEIAALVLMTPTYDQPGFDTKADAHDLDGKMDVLVLSSVEDMNRLDKQGPRAILYAIERDRNAPPDTRRDERILKRRGIPPRLRAFAETNIYGTKMISGVAHFEAWLAAWWARRFETYPHAVLFDGSVDQKNDYADPGWMGGTVVPAEGEIVARVLRWGTRVMVGAELPADVTTIYLRVYATRGDGHTAGQFAQIAYPSGVVSAQALAKSFMGRAPPTETAALVLQPEELPQEDGTLKYGNPSFEAEMRLPELQGEGPYEVRFAFAVGRGGLPANAPGVDPDKPETWMPIPDLFDASGKPKPVPSGDVGGATPGKPPPTPDGPMTPPPGGTPKKTK
jgi:pimeloyl-ACP methyl ester carboxylesterase